MNSTEDIYWTYKKIGYKPLFKRMIGTKAIIHRKENNFYPVGFQKKEKVDK